MAEIRVVIQKPLSSSGGAAVDSVNGKTGVVILDGTDIELIDGGGVSVTEAISDLSTEIDNKVSSVVAGANVEVNNIDPKNPIISAFPTTTAGLLDRTYFTGDEITTSEGTFYKSNRDNKGTVASVEETVTVNDGEKLFFAKDLLSIPYPIDTTIYKGSYSGVINGKVDSNNGEQKFYVEIYKTDINGLPINSGIAGQPIGDLGVEVIAIAESGLIDLQSGNETTFSVTAQLEGDLSLLTTNRIRYHVGVEKISNQGGNVSVTTYYGSNHVAHIDIPVKALTNTVINTDIVEFPSSATQYDINRSLKTTVSIELPTQIEAVVGDTIQLFYQAMVSTPNYDKYHFVGKSSINPTESKSLPRYFETTPTTAGYRELTFYVLDSDYKVLDEKTTTLKVLPAVSSPSTLVSVWNIGDSFINNPTSNDELERRLTGTGGTPTGNAFTNIEIHREGNSGKEWNWYVNDEASPFVYSGVLDFNQYRIDNGLNIPTVALLNLTWNGVGIERSDAEWITWTNDVYTFIDTIKVQFPNIDLKFVSPSMPSTLGGESFVNGANGLNGYGDEYLLKVNLLRMAQIYERIKGETNYSNHVQHIQSSLQVDSVYNVGSTATNVNTRNSTNTELIGNNDVHPTTEGYYQIADAQYRNFIYNYCQASLGAYKLRFRAAQNERLTFSDITLSGDFNLSVDVNTFVDGNTQAIAGFNGSGSSQIILFSVGRIYFQTQTDSAYLSNTDVLPYTGQYNFKMIRVGAVVTYYVDDVQVDTSTGQSGDVVINAIGNKGSNKFEGEMDNFIINAETFTFSEGSGTITQGDKGTTLTLSSVDMWIPE